jgi:hypothetical protein
VGEPRPWPSVISAPWAARNPFLRTSTRYTLVAPVRRAPCLRCHTTRKLFSREGVLEARTPAGSTASQSAIDDFICHALGQTRPLRSTQLLRAGPSTRRKTSRRRVAGLRDRASAIASKAPARPVPRFRPTMASRGHPRSVLSLEEAQRLAAAAVYASPP